MGNGASAAAGVKASVAATSVDDLKATFARLSAEEKSKMDSALAASTTPYLESVVKHMQNREAWRVNGAKYYAWLEQSQEAAIEPDLTIIDPHHHVWDMRELKGFNMFGMFKNVDFSKSQD